MSIKIKARPPPGMGMENREKKFRKEEMHESDKKTVTKQDIYGGYAGGGGV